MVNDFAFDAGGARARPAAAASRATTSRRPTLNLLRAFTKGGFADLHAGAPVEPGVRRELAGGPALRAARRGDRARAALHGGVRHRPRRRAPAARGRLLHVPRGAAARLRGGAHPPRLAHRRLVRLLGAPALDRRAHPPARRRARRVPRRASTTRRRASSGPTATPDEVVALCKRLNPRRSPAGSRSSAAWAPTASRERCRRSCARCARPATRSCGRATRCTATRSCTRAGSRPATSTT